MNCQDYETAQKQLEETATIQRDEFPVSRLQNRTRKEVFQQLYTVHRPWNDQNFDPMLVYQFLKVKKYTRKVSSNGQITHFGYKHTIGDTYKSQYVSLNLDIAMQEKEEPILRWIVSDAQGNFIKKVDAAHLNKKKILDLSVMSKN